MPEPHEGHRRRQITGAWADYPKHVGNLDIGVSEDGCVVTQPGVDKIHFLNPTAALILEFCTGQNSALEITELVKEAYSLPELPVEPVRETLKQLKTEGLLL